MMNTMHISTRNSLLFILVMIFLVLQTSAESSNNEAIENAHIKRNEYSYKVYGKQFKDGSGTNRVGVSYYDDTGKVLKFVSVVVNAEILSEIQKQEELEQQQKDEEAKKQQELKDSELEKQEDYEILEELDDEIEDNDIKNDNGKRGSTFKSLLWNGNN